LTRNDEGNLARATPRRLRGKDSASEELARLLGTDDTDACANAIQKCLLAGYDCERPDNRMPTFAFRVHQFISRGDSAYASIEETKGRHITIRGQQFVPGDRSRILLPLGFCRECGQEYYLVERYRESDDGPLRYRGRELSDRGDDDSSTAGFLYLNHDNPWPDEQDDKFFESIPEDWIEPGRDGKVKVKRDRRKMLPKSVSADKLGVETPDGKRMHFVVAPFRFCLNCDVAYAGRQSDYGKLATLASGGRSTATTTLCLSTIRWLREDGTLPVHARKVLSFTDNRQDASLQAGHFNDFIEMGLLRSGLYNAALAAGPDGLEHSELTQRVFDILKLDPEQYASNPEAKFAARKRTDSALKNVLGYRLYRDLQRGWRITSPNLEQCGLLEIRYEAMDDIAKADELWQKHHPALATASPEER